MTDEGTMDSITLENPQNEGPEFRGFDGLPQGFDEPSKPVSETGTILPRIFSNTDRNKFVKKFFFFNVSFQRRYKIMLDAVPIYVIVIYLIIVLVFLMVVAGVGLFLIPTAEKYQTKVIPYDAEVFVSQKFFFFFNFFFLKKDK